MRYILAVLLGAFLLNNSAFSQNTDVIKVMSYNLLNFPNAGNSNAQGNDASRTVYFRQIVDHVDPDVILMQEFKSIAGATMLVNELNANASTGKTYAHATVFTSYSGLGNMMIYNSSLLTLNAQAELPINNSATAANGNTIFSPRAATLFEMSATSTACATETVDLKFISSHFKAGTDPASSSEIADYDRRDLGAQDILDYINALPTTDYITVVGDMNFYGDQPTGFYAEPGYVNFTNNIHNNTLVDVLGGWTRNIQADAWKYSQSTRNGGATYGNSGAGGGMDDRFDLILFNEAITNTSNAVDYNTSSYSSIGLPPNVNNDILNGSSPIATPLRVMSDHYPVVAELSLNYPACAVPCISSLHIAADYFPGSTDYQVVEFQITADNTIFNSTDITYEAGTFIELQNDFEVKANADFHAFIDGCP